MITDPLEIEFLDTIQFFIDSHTSNKITGDQYLEVIHFLAIELRHNPTLSPEAKQKGLELLCLQ